MTIHDSSSQITNSLLFCGYHALGINSNHVPYVGVSESLEHEITAPPAVEHEVVPAGLHQELRRGCYLSQTEADH